MQPVQPSDDDHLQRCEAEYAVSIFCDMADATGERDPLGQ